MSKLEIVEKLKDLTTRGFRFKIYVCTWRRRRYVVEVSAIREIGTSVSGISWQAPFRPQRELRALEDEIKARRLPRRTMYA
jgi:hypothetical protein